MRLAASLALTLAACSGATDAATDSGLPPVDTSNPDPDGPTPQPALKLLVINEVAAGEAPDWIEIVNATNAPIELSDFVVIDTEGDVAAAVPFPAMTLAPGAYYVQDVDDPILGFKLGSDEDVWIYRASDMALSDGIDWAEGAAPAGMSYARSPDTTGDFVTGAQSKGVANP